MPLKTPIKTEYRQKYPHIQPIGAAFFVTFRLYGSVPKSDLDRLKVKYEGLLIDAKNIEDDHKRNLYSFNIRKKYLVEYDTLLDKINSGPMYLRQPEVMNIIKHELHRYDGESTSADSPCLYELVAYSIMANHVHMLINTDIQLQNQSNNTLYENYISLDIIMKRIKGATASFANKHLGRTGKFWEKESYDIYIRNTAMYDNVIHYILNNPVKAKLVSEWAAYAGNYCKYG